MNAAASGANDQVEEFRLPDEPEPKHEIDEDTARRVWCDSYWIEPSPRTLRALCRAPDDEARDKFCRDIVVSSRLASGESPELLIDEGFITESDLDDDEVPDPALIARARAVKQAHDARKAQIALEIEARRREYEPECQRAAAETWKVLGELPQYQQSRRAREYMDSWLASQPEQTIEERRAAIDRNAAQPEPTAEEIIVADQQRIAQAKASGFELSPFERFLARVTPEQGALFLRKTVGLARSEIESFVAVAEKLTPEQLGAVLWRSRRLTAVEVEAVLAGARDEPEQRPAITGDEKLLASLGTMSAVEYDKSRETIAAKLGVRVRALDAERRQRMKAAKEAAKHQIAAATDDIVEDMNKRHALVWVAGNLFVLWRDQNEGAMPRLSTIDAARAYYRKDMLGDVNPVDWWLGSKARTEFERIGFEPGVTSPGLFNLWRGWAIKPVAGNCDRYLEHVRDVLCKGDARLYEWFLDWCADIVQNPAKPKGTAIAMRGPQGAGKGQAAQYLMAAYAPYTCHLISQELLLGRFNDHFAGKLFIYGDEASWPGDRRGICKLKGLITETRILVEKKMVPAYEIGNYARLMIATNDDWACPADIDDRRFFVLDVTDEKRDDRSYWQALAQERERGGPAALLHFLMHRRICNDLRVAPATAALGEQKLMSLDDIGRFWRRLLMAERHELEIGGSSAFDRRKVCIEFGKAVPTKDVYDLYLAHARQTRVMHPASVDALGKRLRRYCPALAKREARRSDGVAEGARLQVYALPSIADARAAFSAALRQRFEFSQPDDVMVWQ